MRVSYVVVYITYTAQYTNTTLAGSDPSRNLPVSMTHIAASRKPSSQLGCVIVETLEHKETGIRRISAVFSPSRIVNLYIRHRHRKEYVVITEIIHKYLDQQENVVLSCAGLRVELSVEMAWSAWYTSFSDAFKKRAGRYLINRYLGTFLDETVSLDQLSVDGAISLNNVALNIRYGVVDCTENCGA